jgi:hypothetical protein
MGDVFDPADKIIHTASEIIHAHDKQNAVKDPWYEYPFPKPVFPDKVMGFKIRLYRNDEVFEQWELHLKA